LKVSQSITGSSFTSVDAVTLTFNAVVNDEFCETCFDAYVTFGIVLTWLKVMWDHFSFLHSIFASGGKGQSYIRVDRSKNLAANFCTDNNNIMYFESFSG